MQLGIWHVRHLTRTGIVPIEISRNLNLSDFSVYCSCGYHSEYFLFFLFFFHFFSSLFLIVRPKKEVRLNRTNLTWKGVHLHGPNHSLGIRHCWSNKLSPNTDTFCYYYVSVQELWNRISCQKTKHCSKLINPSASFTILLIGFDAITTPLPNTP